MAHYKDGTKASLGDLVRGKGYNRKYAVQGVVVGLTPGAGSCHIHVAHTRAMLPVGTERAVYPVTDEEHGICADFELLECSPLHPGRPVVA